MRAIDALREAWEIAPGAIEGGLSIVAACAAYGTILRWRRLVWAGFAVPQAATVGTAAALGLGSVIAALGFAGESMRFEEWEPWFVLTTGALAVLWLVPVARGAPRGGERAAAACAIMSATATVLLVSRSPHGTQEVEALATGKSLLFLSSHHVRLLTWTLPALVVLALASATPMAAVAFDRDHARATGHRVIVWEGLFALGLLVVVSLSVNHAGAPLAFAYLTLPAAAAERLVARPQATAVVSVTLAIVAYLIGSAAAVAGDLPFSSAAIGALLAIAGSSIAIGCASRAIARSMERSKASS